MTPRNPETLGFVTGQSGDSRRFGAHDTGSVLDSGLVQSMGCIGDCDDNGQMQSFWARMQVELLNRKRWNSRFELADERFDHLEIIHNRQGQHSSPGMLSPIGYARRHADNAARCRAS